jgi:N-acetylmuramoyl-L-alanine amidase
MKRGWVVLSTILLCQLSTVSKALADTVCIDPGHPSEIGNGATSKSISEIRAAWLVAQQMKKEFEAVGVKVVLTKSKETEMVKNRDRSRIANEAKADLLIRLHCDSQSGSGFAVYVPTKQGTAQGKTGPSEDVLKKCGLLGKPFHSTLVECLGGKLHDNGLMSDTKTAVGSQYGALIGSIFSEVPVVLVEMCRLTSKDDEAFIASKKGQDLMAKSLVKASLAAIKAIKEAENRGSLGVRGKTGK